jgi:hypothetical protein
MNTICSEPFSWKGDFDPFIKPINVYLRSSPVCFLAFRMLSQKFKSITSSIKSSSQDFW